MNTIKNFFKKHGITMLLGLSGGLAVAADDVCLAVLTGSCLIGLAIVVSSKPAFLVRLDASLGQNEEAPDKLEPKEQA